MLKLAIISDIHYGPDRGSKKGSAAKELFTSFSNWLSNRSPDMLVDLGDRISDVDFETDLQLAKDVGSWFQKINTPRAHLLGNHDVMELSIGDNEKALGCSLRSHSIDLKGYHLIFWNANSKISLEKGFSLSDSDLSWLKDDLASTDFPCIVFTHIPLDNGSMKGNFYFDKVVPHHAHYPEEQGEQIREILEGSKKVILCLNGHTHWNAYHSIDGVHYVTLPSLIETFPTYPAACEAWTEISIDEEIKIKVFGNLPIEYRLPIRRETDEHWLNMHKEYAPKVATPQ